mmetsp:Transcript_28442/g.60315  ORF Transcript_28442/g.60315 Transcript_28442/m.60315 type:complete len:519 (+) Transcript_28442:678-2234(+)
MTWALVHDLYIPLPSAAREVALHLQLPELGFIIGIANATGAQAVPDAERDIILIADVQDVIPMLIGEVLGARGDAELGVDRTTAAHNTCEALRCERDEAQKHPCVDGPIINALLSLLDESLAEDFPGEVLGDAINLLQRLVDGYSSHRQGAVANNPLTGLVDVLPRAEIHEIVGTPKCAPLQLLHLFLNVGRHSRVANVGVDLHLKLATDDHGLRLRVLPVCGDDGAATSHLRTYELRVHALARGDERHLFGDEATLCVVHLRANYALAVAELASINPRLPQLGQAFARVHIQWATGVVDIEVLATGILVGEVDAAERNMQDLTRRLMLHLAVKLFRAGEGLLELQHILEHRIIWIRGRLAAAVFFPLAPWRTAALSRPRAGGARFRREVACGRQERGAREQHRGRRGRVCGRHRSAGRRSEAGATGRIARTEARGTTGREGEGAEGSAELQSLERANGEDEGGSGQSLMTATARQGDSMRHRHPRTLVERGDARSLITSRMWGRFLRRNYPDQVQAV